MRLTRGNHAHDPFLGCVRPAYIGGGMFMRARHYASVLLLGLALGCHGGQAPTELQLDTDVIPAADILPPQDPAATYEYAFSAVNPDSVLRTLLDAGLPLRQAWMPLDNLCLDPRGPRFTVELMEPDHRMAGFDFLLGTGRLACATRVRHYMVP